MRPLAVFSGFGGSFAATFKEPYLLGLQAALHAVQDADSALLGVKVLPQSQGSVSATMAHHRNACVGILRFLRAGGGR